MSHPTVFISYTQRDSESKQLAESVSYALKGAGWRTFRDEDRIEVGDVWRSDIMNALRECHAGVLLLCQDAIESDWVKQEATILAFIKQGVPDFPLIPVYLDGVNPTEPNPTQPDSGWAALGLDAIQHLRRADVPGTCAAIVRALEPSKQLWVGVGSDALRQSEIAINLGDVAVEKLRNVLRQVKGPSTVWYRNHPSSQLAARQLAARLINLPPRMVVQRLMGLKGFLAKENARRIVELAACKVLPPAAAGQLRAIVEYGASGSLTPASPRTDTAAVQLDRATTFSQLLRYAQLPNDWLAESVDAVTGGEEGELAALVMEVLGRYGVVKEDLDADNQVPIVVFVPRVLTPGELAELREELPGSKLHFVVKLEGDHDDTPLLAEPGVARLEPNILPGDEAILHNVIKLGFDLIEKHL